MFMALATLIAVKCLSATYPVLASVSRSYPGHMGRLPTCYSPVRHQIQESKLSFLSFDLHVLGMPPAFILSQDQTLHLIQLLDVSDIFLYNCLFVSKLTFQFVFLFPVQFSKIICTSAVLIYITKYFSLRQMFFKFFSYFFTVNAYFDEIDISNLFILCLPIGRIWLKLHNQRYARSYTCTNYRKAKTTKWAF